MKGQYVIYELLTPIVVEIILKLSEVGFWTLCPLKRTQNSLPGY